MLVTTKGCEWASASLCTPAFLSPSGLCRGAAHEGARARPRRLPRGQRRPKCFLTSRHFSIAPSARSASTLRFFARCASDSA